MRYFLLALSFILTVSAADAERYTFGPKAGQEIPLEEEMTEQRQNAMVEKLGSIEILMKQNQELLTKQNGMIEQQNQLLNQLYQLNYQQAVQQQQQQQQMQQYPAAVQQPYPDATQAQPQVGDPAQ